MKTLKLLVISIIISCFQTFAQDNSKSIQTDDIKLIEPIIGTVKSTTAIRQDADLYIKRVVLELAINDTVIVDSVIDRDWYKVTKGNYSGYVLTINVKFDSENQNKIDSLFHIRINQIREESKRKELAVEKESKKKYIKKYGKKWGTLVAEKEIMLGMTKDMVIDSWGKPDDINRSVGSWGVKEQWVYRVGQYLYFENGKLISWQD